MIGPSLSDGSARDDAPVADAEESSAKPIPIDISAQDVAARLAKLLWSAAPDAALLADAVGVRTTDDVARLAAKMLADPRARAGVGAFYRWWLRLEDVALNRGGRDAQYGEPSDLPKSLAVFPEWTAEMAADAAKETETFGVAVTLDLNGSLRTLLTAPFSYLNERVAGLYGVAGVSGSEFRKVDLDPRVRAGLLSQPALLAQASHGAGVELTDPPRRAKLVRDRLFCQPVSTNPGMIPAFGTVGSSIRRFFETNTQSATTACYACHVSQHINAIGFAFESFDAIGRARVNDDVGGALDTSGHLPDDDGADIAFAGVGELAAHVADIASVQRCMAKQWLTFALGRAPARDEAAGIDDATSVFRAANLNLRALIIAVASSRAFLARPAGNPPPTPANGTPSGCAQATAIFASHGCAAPCHSSANQPVPFSGFDMETPGWERKLVTGAPANATPSGVQCYGRDLHYLDAGTQPATGLFLDKLLPNPACGSQMPLDRPKLTGDEMACIQRWADNLVAGGSGQ